MFTLGARKWRPAYPSATLAFQDGEFMWFQAGGNSTDGQSSDEKSLYFDIRPLPSRTYRSYKRCTLPGFIFIIFSGALAREARLRSTWVTKSTHPRKFGNHVTVHRPPAARRFAPQAYQCLLSHVLATLGVQEKADCTSMLSSIDSCENRVFADQCHLTVSRAQVSSHQVIRWQFTRFPMIAGSSFFFLIHIK